MRTQGGSVPIISIITKEEVSMMPIALPIFPGVLLMTPVLLTHQKILDVYILPNAVYAINYFVLGIRSNRGINLITATPWSIPGFVNRGKTGMVH